MAYAYTTLVDPLAPYSTYATGINDAGQIVGYTDAHGFLDSGGTYTTLDDPSAAIVGTFATGINASGQIVGYYDDSSDVYHSFLDHLHHPQRSLSRRQPRHLRIWHQ
jgi:uncharacterized membrane protein